MIDLNNNKNDRNSLIENHKKFIIDIKIILKSQKRFKSERQNVFTEEINKIALSPNDDKRIHLIDSIEAYAYGIKKELIRKEEKIKFINIIK